MLWIIKNAVCDGLFQSLAIFVNAAKFFVQHSNPFLFLAVSTYTAIANAALRSPRSATLRFAGLRLMSRKAAYECHCCVI